MAINKVLVFLLGFSLIVSASLTYFKESKEYKMIKRDNLADCNADYIDCFTTVCEQAEGTPSIRLTIAHYFMKCTFEGTPEEIAEKEELFHNKETGEITKCDAVIGECLSSRLGCCAPGAIIILLVLSLFFRNNSY